MAKIVKNQKGKDCIEVDGFIFTLKSESFNGLIWRCKNRECKAKIHTSKRYRFK